MHPLRCLSVHARTQRGIMERDRDREGGGEGVGEGGEGAALLTSVPAGNFIGDTLHIHIPQITRSGTSTFFKL